MNNSSRGGLNRQYQNTQIPGLSQLFNFRVQGLVAGATTAQLFTVQENSAARGQLSPGSLSNPLLAAPTASPTAHENEAQQGLRFFATHFMLMDPNGSLRTTGVVLVQINDVTTGGTVMDSPFQISPGAMPSAVNQAAIYEISGGMGNTILVNAINPYDTLQISLTMPGGTGTATGVNFLLFGVWA